MKNQIRLKPNLPSRIPGIRVSAELDRRIKSLTERGYIFNSIAVVGIERVLDELEGAPRGRNADRSQKGASRWRQ
jgi:hypothetical protein